MSEGTMKAFSVFKYKSHNLITLKICIIYLLNCTMSQLATECWIYLITVSFSDVAVLNTEDLTHFSRLHLPHNTEKTSRRFSYSTSVSCQLCFKHH